MFSQLSVLAGNQAYPPDQVNPAAICGASVRNEAHRFTPPLRPIPSMLTPATLARSCAGGGSAPLEVCQGVWHFEAHPRRRRRPGEWSPQARHCYRPRSGDEGTPPQGVVRAVPTASTVKAGSGSTVKAEPEPALDAKQFYAINGHVFKNFRIGDDMMPSRK
ncbi:hypothetical protein PG994_005092 [Apiospora phragmitis]|uniref:Uncharacterized protein n=1 Tax=Apiospora phragmitis TaxID=2905665 RepID=A0ABR1VWG7_9PEZI